MQEESTEKFLHHLFESPIPCSSLPSPANITHQQIAFSRLRPMYALPASILLIQPPIDRIQARRIAKYRRNVTEVVW